MKPTIQIKGLMIKGGVKPKISQIYNSNHFISNDTTIPGSFVTDSNVIKTEREFENIVTSRKNKAFDFSTVIMDNDYGHAGKGKHEFKSEYDEYEHSLKTYDERSKERLKSQFNNMIDNEYGYIQDRRDAELIRMKSKQEVAQKEKEIDDLKKLIFEKTKREMEYKGKLDKYKSDHAESTKSHSRRGSYASLNDSFKESNEKKIAKALSPYSSSRHSLRRSKRRTSSRVYSAIDSEIKVTQECTPFSSILKNELCKTGKNYIIHTESESADEPYELNVKPVTEMSHGTQYPKETPKKTIKKEQVPCRKNTSPRSSLTSLLDIPRSSKAVPLQSPIDTETPSLNMKAKEDERGWSVTYKENLFTNESNEETLANLVQGDSYDIREKFRDDQNKNNLISETPGLSTYDTRTDIRKSIHSEKSLKKKKKHQIYKGQQRPLATESSDPMSSELDFECIENSISYENKMDKDSLYDESCVDNPSHTEQWLINNPSENSQDDLNEYKNDVRSSCAQSRFKMGTIKELSEENMSQSSIRFSKQSDVFSSSHGSKRPNVSLLIF
jgi:hypothetical protein